MSASDLYITPDEKNLLMTALASNQPSALPRMTNNTAPPMPVQRLDSFQFTPGSTSDQTAPGSGHLDYSDESPFLDFNPDGEFDDFNFDQAGQMIGDLPDDTINSELHEKRKSLDGQDDDDEGGGKRREGEDKTAKKPGRKPLTSEPTNKRKAQNRAAQRAFRERKEKHLKDLETKVEDLEKSSEATNHENGLLKAQVEKLQVELREYRKRLSWIANGFGKPTSANAKQSRNSLSGNDFNFEFPKFGDLPSTTFNSSNTPSQNPARSRKSVDSNFGAMSPVQAPTTRQSTSSVISNPTSVRDSPANNNFTTSPLSTHHNSVDSLSGLFSPSILRATQNASVGYFPELNTTATTNLPPMAATQSQSTDLYPASVPGLTSNTSHSNSPESCSDSNQHTSSNGTSPETLFNSPIPRQDTGLNHYGENMQKPFGKNDLCGCLQQACGDCNNPVPPVLRKSNIDMLDNQNSAVANSAAFDWLAQQNGGGFDPILFGDYRETQDNVLSQDFGSFFSEAFPLPDLGSPLHNYGDVASSNTQPAVTADLIAKVDAARDSEEVVPAEKGNMLTCNKIWDRLQSMEKFRNGEIDIDNLCSELRSKAKCSEGGAVVSEKHVNKILGL